MIDEDFWLGESDDFSLGESDNLALGDPFDSEENTSSVTEEKNSETGSEIDIEKFYKDFVGAFVKSKSKEREYENFVLRGGIKAKVIYDFFKIKPFQMPTELEKQRIEELCNRLSAESEIFIRTDIEKRNTLVDCIGTLKSFFTTGKSSSIKERLEELTWNSFDITIDEKCDDGIVEMDETISLLKSAEKLGLFYDSQSKELFINKLKEKIEERDATIDTFEDAFKKWFEEYASQNPNAYSNATENQIIIARKYKEFTQKSDYINGKTSNLTDKEFVIKLEENLEKMGIKLTAPQKDVNVEQEETIELENDKNTIEEQNENIIEQQNADLQNSLLHTLHQNLFNVLLQHLENLKQDEEEKKKLELVQAEPIAPKKDVTVEQIKMAQDISKDMVLIEEGTFQMGLTIECLSEEDFVLDEEKLNEMIHYSDALPNHTVSLNSFYMNKHEVTQKEYETIMGYNPSVFKGENKPVESVDWYKAVEFCNTLSGILKLTPCYTKKGDTYICDFTGNGYRLPTEAEWEYAARGGKESKWYKYSGSYNIDSVAWHLENSNEKTHDVMTKKANELGLYDMSGNVGEWCWDWMEYYRNFITDYQINPKGPTRPTDRIVRGGDWNSFSQPLSCWFSLCCVFSRHALPAGKPDNRTGFRVVRSNFNTQTEKSLQQEENRQKGFQQSEEEILEQIQMRREQVLKKIEKEREEKERAEKEREEKEREEKERCFENPFVYVEGGTFLMGSAYEDEAPIHKVRLSSFYISNHLVTQKEYGTINDRKPITQVSWYDAIDYCNELSLKEGLTPCYKKALLGKKYTCDFIANGYRLPTEAEWEYAARGGNKSKGYRYSGSNDIDLVAWYYKNSGQTVTHKVMEKQPNELGLYDMSGNVWEWCWDWYGRYSQGDQTNSQGASSGNLRVLRGGSSVAGSCYSTNRSKIEPDCKSDTIGFRLVRSAY